MCIRLCSGCSKLVEAVVMKKVLGGQNSLKPLTTLTTLTTLITPTSPKTTMLLQFICFFIICLSLSLFPFSVLRIINKILSKDLSKKVRQQQRDETKSAFHLFTASALRQSVSSSETTQRVYVPRTRYKVSNYLLLH